MEVNLKFTKQDLITFAVGLAVSVGVVLGEALIRAEEIATDAEKWAIGLVVGLLTATGRYIITYFTEKGVRSTRTRKKKD